MSGFSPYPAGEGPTPASLPAPPVSVQNAVKLMYAGAVFSALGLLLVFSARSQIKKAVIAASPNASTVTVNSAVSLAIGSALIGGLIGVGIWLWMAAMNKRGRAWARVTGTVFFGINTLFVLVGFAQHPTVANEIVSLVTWLVGLGAVILLWRPESSAFFRASKNPATQNPGFGGASDAPWPG